MTFSVVDLLSIFFIGMIFVGMFKIQKAVSPNHYFSMSSLILDNTVSYRKILIRGFLLLAFGAFLSKMFNSDYVITIGAGFGAFLIIWPALLLPKSDIRQFYLLDRKDKALYYFLLIIFLISSAALVYAGVNVSPVYFDIIIDVVKEWIGIFVLGLLGIGGVNKGGKYLDKKITLKINEDSSLPYDPFKSLDGEEKGDEDVNEEEKEKHSYETF